MSIRVALMLLIVVMFSGNPLAYDEGVGDEAPESDVVQTIEADALEELEIQSVTFAPVDGQPVIDGKVDDEFWSQAKVFDLQYELYPIRLSPASVETVGMVALTTEYLYVAFIAHDPNIKDLRAVPREHDGTKEDDYVSIIIDPSGQGAKKYEFRVNPYGSLSDVLQDTISDRWIYDWDTEWTGEAQIEEDRYTAEIAIPLSSFRVPTIEVGELNQGTVVLKRSYPRRVDRTLGTFFIFNQMPWEEPLPESAADLSSQSGVVAAEQAGSVVSDKASSQGQSGNAQDGKTVSAQADEEETSREDAYRNLKITPHYIFHFDEERSIGGTFEQVDEHGRHEVGVDARFQFDSAKSLAVTFNPNFTEVEADIARDSINNPFVAFQPEKRAFFKDASEYYNTLLPIVYTRNIIVPVFGASYMQAGKENSFGAFYVNDEQTELIMPDTFGSEKVEIDEPSNSAAFRFQRSKDKKTIGILSTYRSGTDGYHNAVVGVDGLINLGVDDKIRYQVMYSDTEYPQSFPEDLCETPGCTEASPEPSPCTPGDCGTNAHVLRTAYGETLRDHALRVSYRHDGPKALGWVNYFDIAPDFRADLGFGRKVDIRAINAAFGLKWYARALAGDEGKSRVRFYVIGNHHRSHKDNEEIETGITPLAEFRGSYQTVFRVAWKHRDIAVNRIDQSSLDTGDNAPLFPEDYLFWYYQVSPNIHWTIDFDGRIGNVADADNLVLGKMIEFKPRIKCHFLNFELGAGLVFRDFKVDGDFFYKEQFLTFGLLFRKNRNISHRILVLSDLTRQNVDHPKWLDKSEDERESEKTIEYTLTYHGKKWKVLSGLKFGFEQENDSEEDLTSREVYIKFERQFDVNI